MTTKIRADKVTRDEFNLVKCTKCNSANTVKGTLQGELYGLPNRVNLCLECRNVFY